MLAALGRGRPAVIDQGDLRGTRWRLGAAAGGGAHGTQPLPARAGRAGDAGACARRRGGALLRARRRRAQLAGRPHLLGARRRLHPAPAGAEAHTIVAAGDGLDVLAYGSGSDTGATWLPRAGAMWIDPHWLPFDGPDPFPPRSRPGRSSCPPRAGPPADDRRARRRRASEARHADVAHRRRDLGDALGSVRIGVGQLVVEPGKLVYPPHCHSAEEEVFVVLDGGGELLLEEEEHPVRPGSIVARPPGTGVSHTFRAGDGGMTLLAFGMRDPTTSSTTRARARSRCAGSRRCSMSSGSATGTASRGERTSNAALKNRTSLSTSHSGH